MTKNIAIIVAGGAGTRLGNDLPKQFLPLGNKPLLLYSLAQFHAFGAEIILVLPELHISTWQKMVKEHEISVPHKIIAGGKERFFSVKNALDSIDEEDAIVAIHDAARPFISLKLIESIFSHTHICGSTIPLLPVKESIRQKISENSYKAADRNLFFNVQTPQAFQLNLLKKAYLQPYNSLFTDDATVFENDGNTVGIVMGEEQNFKITSPQDYAYAKYLLENKHLSL